MRNIRVVFLTLSVMCLAVFALVGASTQETPDMEAKAILNTLENADIVIMLPGYEGVRYDLVKLSDAEIEKKVAQHEEKVSQYFAADSFAVKKYPENLRSALKSFQELEQTSFPMDAGMLESKVNGVEELSNGNLQADATLISWLKDIEKHEDGYVARTIVGRLHIVAEMVKEDGVWKVLSHKKYNLEISPENYYDGTSKNIYPTFEAALEALHNTEPYNPYPEADKLAEERRAQDANV